MSKDLIFESFVSHTQKFAAQIKTGNTHYLNINCINSSSSSSTRLRHMFLLIGLLTKTKMIDSEEKDLIDLL